MISDDGTTLVARKAYERAEFLTSTDERFRPVYLSNAPDGTLYLVDMYHGIIQHRDYITEYLRDQILSRKLDGPSGHGRIYRIVHETTRPESMPVSTQPRPIQLVDLLSHQNGWWRDTAQRLLVERGDLSAVGALAKLATSAPLATTRLHALWTLDGLDSLEPALVVRALPDPSRDVRASAIRLAEKWLRESNAAVRAAVLALVTDADWAVRRQLAASLGELPSGARETALSGMLERHGDDPVVVDAALSGAIAIRKPVEAYATQHRRDRVHEPAIRRLDGLTFDGRPTLGVGLGVAAQVHDRILAERRRPTQCRHAFGEGQRRSTGRVDRRWCTARRQVVGNCRR